MKNLILDIKYYLLFLFVVLAAFYFYLNFGINFNKNYAPEIISDASFRDQITLSNNQEEIIFKGALSKKIKVSKKDKKLMTLREFRKKIKYL